jgi:hypothetical protein
MFPNCTSPLLRRHTVIRLSIFIRSVPFGVTLTLGTKFTVTTQYFATVYRSRNYFPDYKQSYPQSSIILNHEDGGERLSRNVGKKLPPLAA